MDEHLGAVCRKTRFETMEDAERRLEELRDAKPKKRRGSSRRKAKPVRAYSCMICGGAHLTHRAKFGAGDE